jgi:hypothetical protein
LTSIEIKFFIRTLFGHNRNEEVFEELNLEAINEKKEDINQIYYEVQYE